MNLLPDITFVYQLILFLAVLAALNYLLYQPFLRVMDKRRSATDGVKEEIQAIQVKTEQEVKEYEEKILKAKSQGIQAKEKLRKEGEEEAGKILNEAKNESEKILAEIQNRLAQEQGEARLQLRKKVEELGKQMAERVLERKIG